MSAGSEVLTLAEARYLGALAVGLQRERDLAALASLQMTMEASFLELISTAAGGGDGCGVRATVWVLRKVFSAAAGDACRAMGGDDGVA